MRRRLAGAALGAFVVAGPVAAWTEAAGAIAPQEAGTDRVLGIEHRTTEIEHRTVGIVRRVESLKGEIRTAETPTTVEVTLAADVLFEFDRADLTAAANARLDEVAATIREGHEGFRRRRRPHRRQGRPGVQPRPLRAPGRGRARRVLVARRTGATFTVAGKGEAEPIAPNEREDGTDDPAGRALNRRVTISFARRG